MFTSADYKTAVAVVEQETSIQTTLAGSLTVDRLRVLADRASDREDYLCNLIHELDPRDASIANGHRLLMLLLADGWTPPEGLF